MIRSQKNLIGVISYIFTSMVGVLILDIIFKDSMYSNLDFLQTIFSFNHTIRYWFFIIFFGFINYLTNFTFSLITIVENRNLDFFINLFLNLVIILLVFYFLQIKNISIIFIGIICLVNYLIYFIVLKS